MVAQCLQLKLADRAWVELTPPPLVVVGQCEDETCLHAQYIPGRSSCDFDGVLMGGRRVSFDTKWTSQARFEFSNVRDTQLEHLSRLDRYGAACFLYVRHQYQGPYSHDYIVHVDAMKRVAGIEHKRSTLIHGAGKQRASLSWDELAPYKVRPGESWLDAWLRLEKKIKEIDATRAQTDVSALGLESLVL